MGNNSVKNISLAITLSKISYIIERKSTKVQMNPMNDVEEVAETRLWLAKFKSAWAITPSKIVELHFPNHMHIFMP